MSNSPEPKSVPATETAPSRPAYDLYPDSEYDYDPRERFNKGTALDDDNDFD